MQIDWFPIDLHVYLEADRRRNVWKHHFKPIPQASVRLHLSQYEKFYLATHAVDFWFSPYHFFSGSKDPHLAEANVKR